MRRRRSKISKPGVSLFPFLAVLICTLGVLIVLLVIAVQSASVKKLNHENAIVAEREQQQAKQAELAALALKKKQHLEQRRAKQRELLEQLAFELEDRELESEGFESDRPRIRREVARARDYRAHLEKELDTLEEEANQLVQQIKLLDTDLASIDLDVDDEELVKLRFQVASAEERLIEKRNSTVLITNKKYAIVPYRGNGGTNRIPVFVECGRDGVVLQPWNIKLTRADFFQPVAAGNPVDAALMAVRNYYQKHDLVEKDQRPYPLLVVRPDGAQSYGLARRSLISWDDEFGYELVTSDKELDFGTIDPQLQDEVRLAVEKSKQIQLALKRRKAASLAMAAGNGDRYGSGGSGEGFGDSAELNSGGPSGGVARETRGTESGGDFRQASFAGEGSDESAGKIATSFQNGSASTANASFKGTSSAESSGSYSMGSNDSNGSLAQSRGANWALPTETGGATGYVRPVSVVVGANSLSLKDVSGKVVSFPVSGDGTEAIDQMVDVVWQRIDSWGIAGANAFWKPNLLVSVQEGAERQFNTIKKQLHNSGLGIQEVGQ